MKKQYLVAKSEDFQPVIEELLTTKRINDSRILVIALEGDLGAGKTTFVQELGKFLNIEEQITSPTFTIMKNYEIPVGEFKNLVHIDAYRIESEEEIAPLRLEAVLQKPATIVCIEWPNNIKSVIPLEAVNISITIGKNEVREVEVLHL